MKLRKFAEQIGRLGFVAEIVCRDGFFFVSIFDEYNIDYDEDGDELGNQKHVLLEETCTHENLKAMLDMLINRASRRR